VEYVVSIINKSAKKLLICLCTNVFKHHASFRVSNSKILGSSHEKKLSMNSISLQELITKYN